jgi:3-oxoadipate enol-lactonase
VKLCVAATPARGLSLTHAGLRRGLSLAACLAQPLAHVESSIVRRILSPQFREAQPEAARRIERPLEAEPTSRADLIKHAIAGALHDARGELWRIKAPTLVLAGELDTLLGQEASRQLAAAIPGAKFDVIAASGHDLTLEQPVATATRVARFFL